MSKMPPLGEWKNLRARFLRLSSGTSLFELNGELDQPAFAGLSDFADEWLEDTDTAVIIDMSGLDFMDSSGVKFINRLVRTFGYGNVAIYRINEDIDRILAILAMEKKITHLSRSDELHSWRGEAKRAA